MIHIDNGVFAMSVTEFAMKPDMTERILIDTLRCRLTEQGDVTNFVPSGKWQHRCLHCKCEYFDKSGYNRHVGLFPCCVQVTSRSLNPQMEYAVMIPADFTPTQLAQKLEIRYELIEKLYIYSWLSVSCSIMSISMHWNIG